jgi:acetyl esterase/lipase
LSSRHLVDPELAGAIDLLPTEPFTLENLQERRDWMAAAFSRGGGVPPAPGIVRSEVFVPGLNGAPDVRLLIYSHEDKGSGRPAYLHIHGGGYIMGSVDQNDLPCRTTAADQGCVVVAVAYRIAPETVFPGNVEDCYAGLKWLHDHAEELGADPNRIAIGGESAGGGMTAALALYNRDKGDVPVIHQQLVYPMLDDRQPADRHPFTGEFGWRHEFDQFGWRCILGQEPGSAGVSPYAAAARAESLEGLPPAFIGVGSLDLFMEANLEYARRLTRAGVPVELHVYPGAYHGSDMVTEARLTRQHARDQKEALRAAFARTA